MPISSTSAPVEILFAQRLASNVPKIREKGVKKLAGYLTQRGALMTDEDMLRIWKGLHYCFWMSDKMLVQEDLAERISGLIHVYGEQREAAYSFIRCGLATMGREWFGLDRFRMDKFMMFARRFLRQAFVFGKKNGWVNVKELSKVFESTVICANKTVKNMTTSIGFQLHFADIYLEELAKVAGSNVDNEVIRYFVNPFINELRVGFDERYRSQIEDRIFLHIMRQTDIGIAYDQKDVLSDDDEEEAVVDEEEIVIEEEDEEEEFEEPKDPRAGNVDVTIPQLEELDLESLAQDLFNAGAEQDTGPLQRALLYRLSKQFKEITKNRYPLSGELSSDEEGPQESFAFSKERKRRMREQGQEYAEIQAEKAAYRQAIKDKRKGCQIPPHELEDREEDNDQVVLQPPKKKRAKLEKVPEVKSKKCNFVVVEEPSTTKRRRSVSGFTEVDDKKEKKKLKAKKKKEVTSVEITPSVEAEVKIDKPLDIKEEVSSSLSGFAKSTIKPKSSSSTAPIFLKKALSKSALTSNSPTKTPKGKKSKRINFSMTSNKYQSVMEHSMAVQESPDIPFQPSLKPKVGLLKNKADISVVSNTPSPAEGRKEVKRNTKINSQTKVKQTSFAKRMSAADFFWN